MSGIVVDDLIRDAGSLHQFIVSIYKRRDEQERVHRAATVQFLSYISELGNIANIFFQNFIERVRSSPADPELLQFDRQGLATIREFWSNLHYFVRPVEDAHTLSIPLSFIEFLEQQLSKIPRLDGSSLVISHTAELNYLQYPRTDLRYNAQTYEAIVQGSPPFPKKLALIAMPYSQGAGLFLNLVICHELGHFAFEELEVEQRLSREIDTALKNALPNYDSLSEPDLSWCRERLKYWSEEIYCDRFAIGLIGPAYSFAYIELFDIVGMSDTDDVREFSDTHPSDACRFREHGDQFTVGNWWHLLREKPRTSYVDLVEKLANIDENSYLYDSEEKPRLAKPTLNAFSKLKPRVGRLVSETLGAGLRQFGGDADKTEINLVKRYLTQGVVPSTLIETQTESFPDPVALINSAYLFYLESLPDLMQRIAGQKNHDLSHRSRWAERVEMWTLKGLEDLSLLSSQRT